MIWAVGILGFICGFSAGLLCLKRWLADRSNGELLHDKNLQRTYGLFVWAVAAITSACAVWAYQYYF